MKDLTKREVPENSTDLHFKNLRYVFRSYKKWLSCENDFDWYSTKVQAIIVVEVIFLTTFNVSYNVLGTIGFFLDCTKCTTSKRLLMKLAAILKLPTKYSDEQTYQKFVKPSLQTKFEQNLNVDEYFYLNIPIYLYFTENI